MMPNRKKQLADLYERESEHVLATVRRKVVGVDVAVVEDACAFAWTALVRRDDIDAEGPTTFSWLVEVAVHEGWRLARGETANFADVGEVDRLDSRADVELVAEAHEALALIDQLKPQQAKVLRLWACGLTYKEICTTLGQSYTAIILGRVCPQRCGGSLRTPATCRDRRQRLGGGR